MFFIQSLYSPPQALQISTPSTPSILPPASLSSSLPSKSPPCQHEPPITKTTTTSLPSKSPPCQGPQPEFGALEGHSGTNHMLWCTLPTENRIALQFLLKSHIFLPYLAVGMVRESTIDAAIINLSCNKSTKEEKEDGEATHSQENRGYWLPEFWDGGDSELLAVQIKYFVSFTNSV